MVKTEINSYQSKCQQVELLKSARRVAVVGIRAEAIYRSYGSAEKLLEYGLTIVPVSADVESILGCPCFARVAEIPGKVDIVQFFIDGKADMRQAAQDAIAKMARGFWVENAEASGDVRALLAKTSIVLVECESLEKEYGQLLVARAAKPERTDREPAHNVAARMTRHPVTIKAEDTIQSALEKMKNGHFHHLPVVDDQNLLLGMFSDRDLRLLHPSPALEPDEQTMEKFRITAVSAAITTNPISVLPDTKLEEAAALMLRWQVGALPVIAGDPHIIGILTVTDLVKEFVTRGEPKG